MGLQELMRGFAVSICCASLLACGGGGGGNTSDASASAGGQVSLVPSPLTGRIAEGALLQDSFAGYPGSLPGGVYVDALVTALPQGPIVPVVQQTGQVFDPSVITVVKQSATDLLLHVPYRTDLIAGTYSGQLKVMLCADRACNTPYPGYQASVPFSVTVTPAVHLTVTVNGVPTQANPVTIHSGDHLEVDSNMTVNWEPQPHVGVIGTWAVGVGTTWTPTLQGSGTMDLVAQSTNSAAQAQLQIIVQ